MRARARSNWPPFETNSKEADLSWLLSTVCGFAIALLSQLQPVAVVSRNSADDSGVDVQDAASDAFERVTRIDLGWLRLAAF